MVTLLVSIACLVLGFFLYGRFVERLFGVDPNRETPAYSHRDGVDFTPMPTWKCFVIQFLNIAGLGPIFGAITGAAFGPMAYVWIVIGCILMGSMHDFFSGAMSMRFGGMQSTEIINKYSVKAVGYVMRFVIALLLLFGGIIFIVGTADLLAYITPMSKTLFIVLIFVYYILATMVSIDKIIGHLYPIFGILLLCMALGVLGAMIVGGCTGSIHLVEFNLSAIHNYHHIPQEYPLLPFLFIVISCGAISGVHATQSPIIARCVKSEKSARNVFYGAMICEGIVALIWATAAINYFGGPEQCSAHIANVTPTIAVKEICSSWLGKVGALLAILGVIVCPLSSGDTDFRALRLMAADIFKIDQKPIRNRLFICIPIFLIAGYFCTSDFTTLWTYISTLNQIVASVFLWTITVFLVEKGKSHLPASIPACFITFVVVSYFIMAPVKNGGLHLPSTYGYVLGGVVTLASCVLVLLWAKRRLKSPRL